MLDKVEEEIAELRAEIATGETARAAEELGDLLFTLVNVARQLGIDPEEALQAMTRRFAARFRRIEDHAAQVRPRRCRPDPGGNGSRLAGGEAAGIKEA